MNKKPNVIFIFSDQQRWDTMGCYGQELDVTPNLDRMAKEGVLFENAFTCQPVCGPARACLQTGKYATEIGCFRNNVALPQDHKTLAHWFSEADYSLSYIGKWHLASTGGLADIDIGPEMNYQTEPIPLEQRGGWKDYWLASDLLEFTSHGFEGHMFDGNMNKVEFQGYRVDKQTDFILEYLKNREDEEDPFFLFTSFLEPHHQNDQNKYVGPKNSREKFADYKVPGDLKGTEGDWKENYPDYLGCCHSIDKNVGRILKELENQGIDEETIIIYTSDHGSHFRTRNGEYKRACHEGCTHIPMLIRGPGFKGGKRIEELVSLIDLPTTLLKSAGLKVPEYMQGYPLQELVEGNVERWRDEVFIQISESHTGRAIRTKRWKYSVRAPGKDGRIYSKSNIYVEDFLYDLKKDPHEKNNLVDDPEYVQVREELSAKLKQRMKDANEKSPKIISAD
ncbi:MAG: sulfatase-like hydrolase/transferase [bacterium]